MVSQKRTNSASASVDRPLLRSSRWTWRVNRSRRRVKAASMRSAPSGDREGGDSRFYDRRAGQALARGEIVDLGDHFDGQREIEAIAHDRLLQSEPSVAGSIAPCRATPRIR